MPTQQRQRALISASYMLDVFSGDTILDRPVELMNEQSLQLSVHMGSDWVQHIAAKELSRRAAMRYLSDAPVLQTRGQSSDADNVGDGEPPPLSDIQPATTKAPADAGVLLSGNNEADGVSEQIPDPASPVHSDTDDTSDITVNQSGSALADDSPTPQSETGAAPNAARPDGATEVETHGGAGERSDINSAALNLAPTGGTIPGDQRSSLSLPEMYAANFPGQLENVNLPGTFSMRSQEDTARKYADRVVLIGEIEQSNSWQQFADVDNRIKVGGAISEGLSLAPTIENAQKLHLMTAAQEHAFQMKMLPEYQAQAASAGVSSDDLAKMVAERQQLHSQIQQLDVENRALASSRNPNHMGQAFNGVLNSIQSSNNPGSAAVFGAIPLAITGLGETLEGFYNLVVDAPANLKIIGNNSRLTDLYQQTGNDEGVGQAAKGVVTTALPYTAFIAPEVMAARGPAGVQSLAKPGSKVIYTVTEDISKIQASGWIWGQTEGSVYGMKVANAPKWRTMTNPKVRDPGTIIFEGPAANLFENHPVEGLYSGLKRALGQQKARFGDIVFDPSTATLNGSTLTIRDAYLAEHAGQSSTWAASRLFGRRILDAGITTGFAYGAYDWISDVKK